MLPTQRRWQHDGSGAHWLEYLDASDRDSARLADPRRSF